MNDNKLSTNLEIINAAVNKMRTSLNAQNLDINKLADQVTDTKASLDGLESNMVYEVNSRSDMAALKNMQDGSACLVRGTETRGINKWDKFSTINFPDRVVLNTPLVEGEVISIGINIKGTGHGTLTGSLSADAFIFGVIIKGAGASAKSITYTANGNTYVRTDNYGSPIISAGELQWNDNYAFDDRLSQFFVADITLEETNIYHKDSWVPVNAGETLELKTTVVEQGNTIIAQTVENARLNSELSTANTTIAQQNVTIAEQSSTITLQTAEIAALNARIEELEGEQEPDVEPEYTYLTVGMRSEDGSSLPSDFEYNISAGRFTTGPDAVSNNTAFSDLPEDFVVGETYTVTAIECDSRYEIIGNSTINYTVDNDNHEAMFIVRPKASEQTLLQHGEHLTAGTRLILPAVEPYEHSCSEINDLTLNTQLVYMNDGNAVLSIKNIENMGMTMVEVGPSSSDNMLTYMFEGEATNIGDLKVYTFDSGSLTNYDDEIGNIEIIVNRDTEVNNKLFDNLVRMLTELKEQYPKNIEIRNED